MMSAIAISRDFSVAILESFKVVVNVESRVKQGRISLPGHRNFLLTLIVFLSKFTNSVLGPQKKLGKIIFFLIF